MSTPRRLAASALLVLLAACAGNPGPGEPGYAFNVSGDYAGQFIVEGQSISATLSLQTATGGVVSGQVRVPEMGISSEVQGMVSSNQLTLRLSYHNPSTRCDGAGEGTATIAEGGATFSGPMTVTECGQSMGASFSFRR
ncbi:MAG: hypothetical protein FIA95_16550 [Gemmatimonadetes bacterium]|nr:hypothetical protein [Gemmatimonadota bacterium]